MLWKQKPYNGETKPEARNCPLPPLVDDLQCDSEEEIHAAIAKDFFLHAASGGGELGFEESLERKRKDGAAIREEETKGFGLGSLKCIATFREGTSSLPKYFVEVLLAAQFVDDDTHSCDPTSANAMSSNLI
ncbi:hypothetical protein U1Q18_021519 [Sarracenia purpurea var. burkii]